MFELRLVCVQESVEVISDALQALGALSVNTEDADADTQVEHALFAEPGSPPQIQSWARTRVNALFRDEARAREAARLLSVRDFFKADAIEAVCAVREVEWVRVTQSQFKPVAIASDFWIVPSWHEVPAAARYVIRLDPGLAFGTGTHPTTRMCLRWIARHDLAGKRVLDYGCGSGILAIAAALFGAAAVDAVDIDPAAVESTRANAAANGGAVNSARPDAVHGSYDLITANILASPLKVLAPLLCSHVARRGSLILAGILERQIAELQDAYRPWLTLEASDRDEGWALLTGERGSSPFVPGSRTSRRLRPSS